MANVNKESFDYLGSDFQLRLVAQLLSDSKFAESIIEIINPNYFGDPHHKLIVSTIIDAYHKDRVIPDMGSIEFRILDKITNEIDQKFSLAQLKTVREVNLNDSFAVQEKAMKFCKGKELKKTVKEIESIIDKGDDDKLDECEELLKKALQYGNRKDDGINVLDNIDAVLIDDFRNPIPTGIKGLDDIMDGGLSKGELGVILAPFGAGKTTMMTKIANTAKNLGKNVLQIIFEDAVKVIQRKHISCWSGYELNDLSLHKDELKELVEKKRHEAGILKIKKFPSDGTTIPIIRQYIRKQIAQGFRPDIILLDYIDCVQSSKKIDDANVAEGSVMRQFETLLSEFDIAGWTAIQGNRSSIKSEVVHADQMAGSIKKGQIAHFILSIAKTLDQKEAGTATITILKSRFSKDGMILENVIFDNSRIQIDMNEIKTAKTESEYNKDKEREQNKYIGNLLSKRKQALSSNGLPA